MHIISLKQSAVIFVCVLKKKPRKRCNSYCNKWIQVRWWTSRFKAIDGWRILNKVQDIILKKYLSEKLYFNSYCMYTEIVYFVSIKIPLGGGGLDPASNRLKSFFLKYLKKIYKHSLKNRNKLLVSSFFFWRYGA